VNKSVKIIGAVILGGLLLTGGASGCTTDADMASENLSTAAEQFEVQRRITVVNSFSDKVVFEVEGRCSIEPTAKQLVAICKHGENDFRKHYTGIGDNGIWSAFQLDPIDVDTYHTRLIVKPETVLPDFDLETSGDLEGDG
jgi:hypothetical protein